MQQAEGSPRHPRLHVAANPRVDEKTIQLSIRNFDYAQSLSQLLSQDGDRRVFFVEQPNSRLDGVVVMDEWGFVNLDIKDIPPERIVIIAPKKTTRLSRTWDTGIRNVVFEEDSLEVVKLAILFVEVRLRRSMDRE